MIAYRNLIVEALVELSDASYQERVWAGGDPAEMSSFTECIEQLFDDSGLTLALSHGSVFGPPADEHLRVLSQLVDLVDAGQPVDQLLRDAGLAECRQLAGDILQVISALDGQRSDD